ncbi:CCNK family protein [Megaselia abdita]
MPPCWYYEKKELKDTPSMREGISFDTERRYRKEGARFILNCGTSMSLGHNTIATGVVYFHRFYMFHSFKTFPRFVTACCCLLLAGKVEETPKKCRDIIKCAKGILTEDQYFSFGDDPKEEVMTLERILLQTIKFDLQVDHPYHFLLKYAKSLKGDQSKLQKVAQMAWNFVNDSLSTTVCLQWEPEIIAVAMIHLASKLTKFAVVDWIGKQPSQSKWWDMFVSDITIEILEDICHQVLDLYSKNQVQPENSPPQQPPSRSVSPNHNQKVVVPPKLPEEKIEAPIPPAEKPVAPPPHPPLSEAIPQHYNIYPPAGFPANYQQMYPSSFPPPMPPMQPMMNYPPPSQPPPPSYGVPSTARPPVTAPPMPQGGYYGGGNNYRQRYPK